MERRSSECRVVGTIGRLQLVFEMDLPASAEMKRHYTASLGHELDIGWGDVSVRLPDGTTEWLLGGQDIGNFMGFFDSFREAVQRARSGETEIGEICAPGNVTATIDRYFATFELNVPRTLSERAYQGLSACEVESSNKSLLSVYSSLRICYFEVGTVPAALWNAQKSTPATTPRSLVWLEPISPTPTIDLIDTWQVTFRDALRDYAERSRD